MCSPIRDCNFAGIKPRRRGAASRRLAPRRRGAGGGAPRAPRRVFGRSVAAGGRCLRGQILRRRASERRWIHAARRPQRRRECLGPDRRCVSGLERSAVGPPHGDLPFAAPVIVTYRRPDAFDLVGLCIDRIQHWSGAPALAGLRCAADAIHLPAIVVLAGRALFHVRFSRSGAPGGRLGRFENLYLRSGVREVLCRHSSSRQILVACRVLRNSPSGRRTVTAASGRMSLNIRNGFRPTQCVHSGTRPRGTRQSGRIRGRCAASRVFVQVRRRSPRGPCAQRRPSRGGSCTVRREWVRADDAAQRLRAAWRLGKKTAADRIAVCV